MITAGKPVTGDQLIGRQKEMNQIFITKSSPFLRLARVIHLAIKDGNVN